MNITKFIVSGMAKVLPVFLYLSALVLTTGCKSDPGMSPEDKDKSVQEWIYSKVEEWYLWNDDVKAKTKNYSLGPEDFFTSLLSTNRADGKTSGNTHNFYSYMDVTDVISRADGIVESSFGFDYIPYRHLYDYDENHVQAERLYATVIWVRPGSPADKAGIKRGHNIGSIDGVDFRSTTDMRPLKTRTGQTLSKVTVSVYSPFLRGSMGGYAVTGRTPVGKFTLTPEQLDQTPVLEHKVMPAGSARVGYLNYLQFERGGDSRAYDEKLKEVFTNFRQQGVNKVILDLRYNPGGYVTSCQLLASLLAPESYGSQGRTFQIMDYNDTKGQSTIPFLPGAGMANSVNGPTAGVNLGVDAVYILATDRSASASEAIIHCLKGAGMSVYHIGEKTEGKNVGMSLFDSKDNTSVNFGGKRYQMYPVTFYVCDAEKRTYSSQGLTPDFECADYYFMPMQPFGTSSDPLFFVARNHIENGIWAKPGSIASFAATVAASGHNTQYESVVPASTEGLIMPQMVIEENDPGSRSGIRSLDTGVRGLILD